MTRTFPLLTALALGTGIPAMAQMYIADNFSIASATVAVSGDVHSATDISGNGVLLLNNTTGLQSVDFGGNAIPVLEVSNPAGVALAGDLRIAQELRLTGGKVRLDGATLTLAAGAMITGSGTDRYIVTDGSGIVTAEDISAGAAFTFPVGKSDIAGDYTPATVTNQAAVRSVSVQVNDYAGMTVPSAAHGIDRAWQIWADAAGNADIALTHNAATEGTAFNRDSAYVSQQLTAGTWSVGMPSTGTNGGFTHSGSFTLPASAGPAAWFTKIAQASASVTQTAASSIRLDVIPNPFVQEASLQIAISMAQQVRYTLTDVAGKLIASEALQPPAGTSTWPLPVTELKPGVYLLHVSGMHMDAHLKIIRQ